MAIHPRPYLATGEHLLVDDALLSINRRYLAVLQRDGNFCVYPCTPKGDLTGGAVWASGKQAQGGEFFALPQTDGNLCVYIGRPDHNLGGLWCITGTPAPEGAHHVILDAYGRLCVYEGATPDHRGKLLHRTSSNAEPHVDDDQGKYLWTRTATRWLRQPFFYNHRVHAVTPIDGQTRVATPFFTLNADGKPDELDWNTPVTAVARSWGWLATCVYRSQAWLFFDSMQQQDRWRYDIRFKTSNDPTKGWVPERDTGFETGLTGSYADWGAGLSPACIDAKELNGKLFLFYYRDDHIQHAVYDGDTWTERPLLLADRYHPNFSLCSATRNGEPVIVLAGIPNLADVPSGKERLHLTVISGDGKVAASDSTILDWVQRNNRFGLAHGSIAGSPAGNVLQIFANNSGAKNDLRRAAFDLDSMRRIGEWTDTTLGGTPRNWSYCDVATAAVREGEDGDFRQHLVVVHSNQPLVGPEMSGVASYPSDLFRCDHVSEPASTHDDKTREPGAWTLLGVIEGIPPFTRNGDLHDPPVETSKLDYAQTTSEKLAVTEVIETGVSMSFGSVASEAVGSTVELEASFAVTNAMTFTVSQTANLNLGNRDYNKDGTFGWLVVSQPQLVGRRYTRLHMTRRRTWATSSWSPSSASTWGSSRTSSSARPRGCCAASRRAT
jgi:hypothetical protein